MEIENRLPDNIGNRPSETLRKIFLWCSPHTCATIKQRIEALTQLATEQPDTTWLLILKLIPSSTEGFCDSSSQPRWREWALGWTRDGSRQDMNQYKNSIADFVLKNSAEDPHRWSQILEGIIRCNPRVTTIAFETMNRIAANSTDVSGRSALWTELNKLIICLLYTSPSPRDQRGSRMPSSA